MVDTPAPSEYRTVLSDVSWQKYETLLARTSGDRKARFTFNRGQLEMMNPLEEHERCNKLIESLILVLVDELRGQVEGYMAPTLKRHDLGIGTEPDAGYYVQTAMEMKGKAGIDLMLDPAPDLIFEVELTRSPLNKFAIYAQLGIPEVWRYISKPGETFLQGKFFIHCLHGDRYLEDDFGRVFPFLSGGRILQFIDQSDTIGLAKALQNLRDWMRSRNVENM
jgi:Uma2 family endonuclease